MPPIEEEHVLCSQATELPKNWLPDAAPVPLPADEIWSALSRRPPHWLPRSRAEQDPSHKQWIPYVLLLQTDDRIAAYPRQGTETRLHGLWSVGIGGHVNPIDAPAHDGPFPWKKTLENAVKRELREEYPGLVAGEAQILGLIHENRTAVGRVHLGVVFLFRLAGVTGTAGAELAGLQWIRRRDIGEGAWPITRFELWSQLALHLLASAQP